MECVSIPKEFLNQLALQLADMRQQLTEANKKIEELSKKKTKKVKVIETSETGSYVPPSLTMDIVLSDEDLAKKAKKVAAAAHARQCKAAKKEALEAAKLLAEETDDV